MSNFAVSLFYLYVVYECFSLSLIVLDHLVFNYLLLLEILIKKILVYPTIIYINTAFGMALIFAYNVLKLILQNLNIGEIISR